MLRVSGFGFRVSCFGFHVSGFESRLQPQSRGGLQIARFWHELWFVMLQRVDYCGLWSMVCVVHSLWCMVSGAGFGVDSFGSRVFQVISCGDNWNQ